MSKPRRSIALRAASFIAVILITAIAVFLNAGSGLKTTREFSNELIQRLPKGALYMDVGTNGLSMNVWLLQRQSNPLQLTKNRPGFGISSFSASQNAIVLADAANGVDELKVMSGGRLRSFDTGGAGHGVAPSINDRNEVAFVTIPFGKVQAFRVGQESLSGGAITWVGSTTSKWGVSAPVWGPNHALAYVSPLSPLGNSEKPLIYVISKRGKRSIFKVDGNVNSLTWGEHAPLLALGFQDGSSGCLDLLTKSFTPIPRPWYAKAWSPDGSQLLVDNGHTLGLWIPAHPATVHPIGSFGNGYGAGQIEWLPKPAMG